MKYTDWPLSAPVNLTWEITHACNLRCVHCLSASSTASPGELDEAECRAIVDQLAAARVFEINFGGGEPFLVDYFFPLLDYIHGKGIVTCISTNGTLIDKGIAARLAGNPLINVQVSLDGATPEVNNRIRGEGTYEKIIRGLDLLGGKGIQLSVNTVVTSMNYWQLEDMKTLATAHGARLRVSRFRPSGRARESWDTLRLGPEQLRELSDWLGADPTILTGDSFFSISQDGRRELGLDMCGACKMTCCIDPVGNVFPCAFLQEPRFSGGNLRETAFRDIWDNSASFKYFRNLEPASCLSCPRYEKCRGGCPAVAYFVSHDLDSPDPECLVNWSQDFSVIPGDNR